MKLRCTKRVEKFQRLRQKSTIQKMFNNIPLWLNGILTFMILFCKRRTGSRGKIRGGKINLREYRQAKFKNTIILKAVQCHKNT